MSNSVPVLDKNGDSCLKTTLKVIAAGFVTTAVVAAVSGAIFLMIAASVNPVATPGFLGYMAMVIAKAPPCVPVKTFIYAFFSIAILLTSLTIYLFLKTRHELSSEEFWKRNWKPEIFSDSSAGNYFTEDGQRLTPNAKIGLLSYLRFLELHGRDVHRDPENFLEITNTRAYRALRFGDLSGSEAREFEQDMRRKALPHSSSSFLFDRELTREEWGGYRELAEGSWDKNRSTLMKAFSGIKTRFRHNPTA